MKKLVFSAATGENTEIEMTTEEIAEWEELQNAFVPPEISKRLYKSTFIRRLNFEEATALEQILNEQEPYLRLLYNSVEWFDMDDGFVTYLSMILTEAFGEDRSIALLEPEQ